MSLPSDVIALRPFVPAIDFETSLRFYTDLGFSPTRLGAQLAVLRVGSFSFLLRRDDAEDFATNFAMHLMVADLAAWWAHIQQLDLPAKYGVGAPTAPKLQSWGLVVAYVWDPSGVLWHFAEQPADTPAS